MGTLFSASRSTISFSLAIGSDYMYTIYNVAVTGSPVLCTTSLLPRVASFPFSKRSNSVIFCDCNFSCFLGFYATSLRNPMSESAEISRV